VSTTTGCDFEHADGAYVLGALSAAERLDFERHLTGCEACTARVRQLAGLPGLLGRVGAEVLEEVPPPGVPATLMPAVAARVRREQRRRTTVAALLAAAVAALVVGVGAVWVDAVRDDPAAPSAAPTPGPGTAMEPVGGDVPVRASLTLEDVTWGTRIGLLCTYDPATVEYEPPAEVTYLLVVRTRDGGTEQVGTWRSVGGRTMRLEAGTATRQQDIASVEVRTTDGRVVLASSA
jgi:hypothetical protein